MCIIMSNWDVKPSVPYFWRSWKRWVLSGWTKLGLMRLSEHRLIIHQTQETSVIYTNLLLVETIYLILNELSTNRMRLLFPKKGVTKGAESQLGLSSSYLTRLDVPLSTVCLSWNETAKIGQLLISAHNQYFFISWLHYPPPPKYVEQLIRRYKDPQKKW